MTVHRALVWAIALALPLAACGNKEGEGDKPATSASATPAPPPTTSASAAPAPTTSAAAPPAEKAHWKHHKGAELVWMLFHAAHGLPDLKEPQKAAIDKAAETLHNDHSGPSAEMKAYHEALLTQIKAGKIEPAKLEPLMGPIEKAQKARHEKVADALNALYAALEPAQRKAVVATVKAKHAEHLSKRAERAAGKHRAEHLTKELGLDAGQQKKVEAIIGKDKSEETGGEESKKHAEAILTAFEGEGFDAKKHEPPASKRGIEGHLKFLTALLPILKPEQRDKLAASMSKEHPDMPSGEDHEEEAPAKP